MRFRVLLVAIVVAAVIEFFCGFAVAKGATITPDHSTPLTRPRASTTVPSSPQHPVTTTTVPTTPTTTPEPGGGGGGGTPA